jgi:hypothetical protein
VGDKLLPEIGQVAHLSTKLKSWASDQHPKSNRAAKLKTNIKPWQQVMDGSRNLPPEKRGEAKKQAPSKQAQWKPSSITGQLVDYKADSGIWGQYTNLNCHTSLREELTKQLPLKDRRKKKNTTQPPDKTRTELWLKYQHHNWMLAE